MNESHSSQRERENLKSERENIRDKGTKINCINFLIMSCITYKRDYIHSVRIYSICNIHTPYPLGTV